jgi:hypothetical protein
MLKRTPKEERERFLYLNGDYALAMFRLEVPMKKIAKTLRQRSTVVKMLIEEAIAYEASQNMGSANLDSQRDEPP